MGVMFFSTESYHTYTPTVHICPGLYAQKTLTCIIVVTCFTIFMSNFLINASCNQTAWPCSSTLFSISQFSYQISSVEYTTIVYLRDNNKATT